MKRKVLILFLLVLLNVVAVSTAEAKTGISSFINVGTAHIGLVPFGNDPICSGTQGDFRKKNENNPSMCIWGEPPLAINGKMAYCLDWTLNFYEGNTYTEIDPLKYFMKNGKSEEESLEAIKKMALMEYYFKKESEVKNNTKAVYLYTQLWVWSGINALHGRGLTGIHSCVDSTCDYKGASEGVVPAAYDGSAKSRYDWMYDLLVNKNKKFYEDNKNKYDIDLSKVHLWVHDGNQPVIQFDDGALKEKGGYDFSIDAACVNCAKTGKSNVSYIIQDVDNWELFKLLYSDGFKEYANTTKLKEYYQKGLGINQVCREEYQITFPEQTDVRVDKGGYFTVNEDAFSNNFKPFNIKRIIQCKTYDEGRKNFTKGDGNKLKNRYCVSGQGDAGKVKISYKENYSNPYKYNGEMRMVNRACGLSYSGDMATLVISSDYKLKSDVFKYIRKGSARALENGGAGNNSTVLPYPNFPVHYNRSANNNELAGRITVQFDLPSSKFKDAFNDSQNGLLVLEDDDKNKDNVNMYNYYGKDNEIANISIKNSACAKMFGSSYSQCISSRKGKISKKISECRNQNESSGSVNNNGYTCKAYMKPSDDNTCIIISVTDKKYIGKDGKIVSENTFKSTCCNKDNYKILGMGYNFKTNRCESSLTGESCNKSNVGTGTFSNYVWSIKDGKPDCCSPAEVASGKCFGKSYCKDGVNGPCGDRKLCVCDADNKCPEDHANGKCPNKGDGCSSSGSSYQINGQSVDKDRYIEHCCNQSNAKSLGREWNSTSNMCCGEGEKYNKLTGRCVSAVCCDKCGSDKCCDDDTCGEIIDGELVCHGKVRCNTPSCKDELVYRVVDLKEPFVNEDGQKRYAGANWAALTDDGTKFNSNANNPIINSVFKDGEDVYKEGHVMYRFTLDYKSIDKIRRYNKNNSYADFTLRCTNGTNCKSDFIRGDYFKDRSGKCINNAC